MINSDSKRPSYWAQTGRRHHVDYYKLLNSAKLTFTFVGKEYLRPLCYKGLANRLLLKWNQIGLDVCNLLHLDKSRYFIIYRFDSWRFRETILSNSVPIRMDFKNWKFVLPLMPENGIHYIGVQRYSFVECAEKIIAKESKEFENILKNGKEWVLKNYTPFPTAVRLITMIKNVQRNV